MPIRQPTAIWVYLCYMLTLQLFSFFSQETHGTYVYLTSPNYCPFLVFHSNTFVAGKTILQLLRAMFLGVRSICEKCVLFNSSIFTVNILPTWWFYAKSSHDYHFLNKFTSLLCIIMGWAVMRCIEKSQCLLLDHRRYSGWSVSTSYTPLQQRAESRQGRSS